MQLRSLPTLDPIRLNHPEEEVVQPSSTRLFLFLNLTQPAYWLMPIWALLCGVLTTGEVPSDSNSFLRITLAVLLVGPFLGSALRLLRSYFERDLDAINFPFRPLPAGAITPDRVITFAAIALVAGLLSAQSLGNAPFLLTSTSIVLGLVLFAPPMRLRRNSWLSPLASAAISVGLPWMTGQALFAPLNLPSLVLPCLFTFGFVGIELFLGLHHIEGDRRVEIRSLAAIFGQEISVGIAALLIDTALLGATILGLGSQNLVISGFLLTTLLIQAGTQLALFSGLRKGSKKADWHLPIASVLFGVAMMLAAVSSCLVPLVVL